jgi:cation transport regulator ChaB
MATTVNNTTVNTKLTIIFDADINSSSTNDGPASGSGNTESDVYLDNKTYLNLRSHTEINNSVHALQWDATTNTGTLEFTDSRNNESISSLPQWATNVVIRAEAQDVWNTNYNSTYDGHSDARAEDDSDAVTAATTAANTARNNYLSGHSITY